MIKRFLIAIVLLGIVGGGIVGFNMFRDQAIEGFFANRTAPAVPVDTVVAEAGDWVPAIETIGTVYASQGIELAIESGGVVREVGFKPNDRVEEGQILVRIADEIEQADLTAAEASVFLAEQSLNRQTSLGDRGIASTSTIEEAQASVSSARAQVQRIQAQIDQKILEAPFAGEIGISEVEVGQFVTTGTPVATLQDTNVLRVDFTLPEQSQSELEIGQSVTVRSEAGAEASGFVTAIEPRIDPATRLISVRAQLDNREGVLSPGQFVRIRLALPADHDVISLPQTSVITSLYGNYVFVVEPADGGGNQVRQAFVKTGARIDELVEVTSGIEPGDRVVIAGQNRLFNGSPVSLPDASAAPASDTPAAEEQTSSTAQASTGAAQAAEASE